MQRISDVAELAKVQSIVSTLTKAQKKVLTDIFLHPAKTMNDWFQAYNTEEYRIAFDCLCNHDFQLVNMSGANRVVLTDLGYAVYAYIANPELFDISPVKNSPAQQIKSARADKGLSQQQLGEVVGVTAQAVSKWEQEKCLPDVPTIPAIVNALGLHGIEWQVGDIQISIRPTGTASTSPKTHLIPIENTEKYLEPQPFQALVKHALEEKGGKSFVQIELTDDEYQLYCYLRKFWNLAYPVERFFTDFVMLN